MNMIAMLIQTDRLLRVFHSCYFHYSAYVHIIKSILKYCKNEKYDTLIPIF